MPPKRKAGGSRGRGNKKAAVSRSKDQALPEDASKHVDVRVLVPTSVEYDAEEVKKATEVTELSDEQPSDMACERVIAITGTADRVSRAIGHIAGTRVQLLVSEAIVMDAKLNEDAQHLKQIRDECANVRIDLAGTVLPMSNERILGIESSDSIEFAVVRVLTTLEQYKDSLTKFPVVKYIPRPISGVYGHPDTFRRQFINEQQRRVEANDKTVDGAAQTQEVSLEGKAISLMAPDGLQQAQRQASEAPHGRIIGQQIYVPLEMIGSIIGKAGSKINEIRSLSGSAIKINEEEQNGERMVTVTGSAEANQMALYLIYQKIDADLKKDAS